MSPLCRRCSDGYFEFVGASAVGGRDFDAREYADGLDVVIVNEPFVRDRLHGVNAVGRRIRVVPENARNRDAYPWATVVGVVPDLGLSPGNPARAAAGYRPLMDINIMRLAIRGISEPGAWTPPLIEIATQVDPGIRVQWFRTLAAGNPSGARGGGGATRALRSGRAGSARQKGAVDPTGGCYAQRVR